MRDDMKYFRSIALLALLVPAAPAHASGGLWCNVDDANVKLDVESGVTRGMGSPFFNFRASAELKDKRVMPEFRTLDLGTKLVHSWVNGGTKLSFYTEIEKDNAVYSAEIVIDTVQGEEEGDDAGTYTIVTYGEAKDGEDGRVELTGPVICGGE
jgi:hypothetical protein